jgi:hypothetical protein
MAVVCSWPKPVFVVRFRFGRWERVRSHRRSYPDRWDLGVGDGRGPCRISKPLADAMSLRICWPMRQAVLYITPSCLCSSRGGDRRGRNPKRIGFLERWRSSKGSGKMKGWPALPGGRHRQTIEPRDATRFPRRAKSGVGRRSSGPVRPRVDGGARDLSGK